MLSTCSNNNIHRLEVPHHVLYSINTYTFFKKKKKRIEKINKRRGIGRGSTVSGTFFCTLEVTRTEAKILPFYKGFSNSFLKLHSVSFLLFCCLCLFSSRYQHFPEQSSAEMSSAPTLPLFK